MCKKLISNYFESQLHSDYLDLPDKYGINSENNTSSGHNQRTSINE